MEQARSLLDLADVLVDSGDLDRAREWLEAARIIFDSLGAKFDRQRLDAVASRLA